MPQLLWDADRLKHFTEVPTLVAALLLPEKLECIRNGPQNVAAPGIFN
jgi:hypothetical protein